MILVGARSATSDSALHEQGPECSRVVWRSSAGVVRHSLCLQLALAGSQANGGALHRRGGSVGGQWWPVAVVGSVGCGCLVGLRPLGFQA